jgi:hypothetical protein
MRGTPQPTRRTVMFTLSVTQDRFLMVGPADAGDAQVHIEIRRVVTLSARLFKVLLQVVSITLPVP